MDTIYIGALDIGGTKIAATIADAKGPLAKVSERTVKSGPARALGDQVLSLLERACEQAGVEPGLLNSVGVSSCGPFLRVDGMVCLTTPNICGGRLRRPDLQNDWEIIPLEQVLRERFDKVVIENDCVAALVAERTFGAVRNEPDCVYATWSTGIGFGLCVDGRILRGKHGNAGHAGHMLMSEQSQALCGCGNRGDLEAVISGRNIGQSLNLSAEELFAQARAGNRQAEEAAISAARWFGRALYNLVATLDTRVFAVGGSIWTHHGEWLKPAVMEELEKRMPALTEGVSVVPAALGSFVADVGALSLVIPPEWIESWSASEPWRTLAASAPAQLSR
ncbi:ROK family protein [Noviherbaspirillum massiliense]|uniref:ROK family protein n=1 Tax=Noviherbaspirillum massiliense TaxID=1465823 RepID=UPI0002DA47CB|nr:ROK family protein [Noviherbaspirillum massiliense]